MLGHYVKLLFVLYSWCKWLSDFPTSNFWFLIYFAYLTGYPIPEDGARNIGSADLSLVRFKHIRSHISCEVNELKKSSQKLQYVSDYPSIVNAINWLSMFLCIHLVIVVLRKLEDSEAAEQYCAEIGRSDAYMQYVFLSYLIVLPYNAYYRFCIASLVLTWRLLDMYLDPQDGKEMFKAAVRLLHSHGESLDPMQVLEVLNSWLYVIGKHVLGDLLGVI